MQEHHKSHGSRSEVHIGGSQRVGGLAGDAGRGPVDHRRHSSQLPRRIAGRSAEPPGDLLDTGRQRAPRAARPHNPGTPPGAARRRSRPRARESDVALGGHSWHRGADPAAHPGPPCGVELLAEAFTLALPPIPVTLRARQLLAQTSDLFLLPLEQIVAFGPGRLCALIDHTRFMAASRQKYKYGIVDLAESPAKRRPSETGRYSAFWPGTAITSTRSRLSAMTTRRRRCRTVRRRSGTPFRRRTEAIETMSSLPRSNS